MPSNMDIAGTHPGHDFCVSFDFSLSFWSQTGSTPVSFLADLPYIAFDPGDLFFHFLYHLSHASTHLPAGCHPDSHTFAFVSTLIFCNALRSPILTTLLVLASVHSHTHTLCIQLHYTLDLLDLRSVTWHINHLLPAESNPGVKWSAIR